MPSSTEFCPNWASAPGETIADILTERRTSIDVFAQEMGFSSEYAEDLLRGRMRITLATARELSRVLGASIEFWMARDFRYQQSLERQREKNWLAALPIRDMKKFGWVEPEATTSDASVYLRFFGVDSVEAWHQRYASVEEMVVFRKSGAFQSELASTAAWLRQGERVADGLPCQPWSPEKFREALARIRGLTKLKDPQQFLPRLQEMCTSCGVAVAVVRTPQGCRASGAVKVLSPQKALLLLSFRHLTDDHFWFTFFHEAGHLLLHHGQKLIVEGLDFDDPVIEAEANTFAGDVLIPTQHHEALLRLKPKADEVIRFAVNLGISPGIVVGQLQHRGVLRHDQLNRLKRRFQWSE